MGLKVCIVGLAPSTHDAAPWDDKTWQKWGLPWDGYWARMDRLFEMHDLRLIKGQHARYVPDYLDRLRACDVPLYMQQAYDEIPNAKAFPFDEVGATTGHYWNSSIAYLMAMAIHEGAEEISIYGVDMDKGEEYAYQRPNMEYLIGLARGKGIKVFIPEASPLCKFQPTGIRFYDHMPTYTDRYGWLG